MRVHFYGSWRHYVDHLYPVWKALPKSVKGYLLVPTEAMAVELRADGIHAVGPRERQTKDLVKPSDRVVVAGFKDVRAFPKLPVCLMEHGAGQTYVDVQDGCYAGGRGRTRVSLFLVPNEETAVKNLRAYPQHKVEVVGCPRLDVLWRSRVLNERHRDGNRVAVSFHWRCGLTAEAGSAWDDWKTPMKRFVAASKWQVLGHGHPRLWNEIERWWRRLGVEPVPQWESVVRRADVYVCDNSSTLFEAAALNLPVVLLNANHWRFDVEHGRRFWADADMGPLLWPEADLAGAIKDATGSQWEDNRRAVAERVYSYLPDGKGTATAKAVTTILEWAL